MANPPVGEVDIIIPDEKTTAIINKYDIPEPEPFISFNALKERIRHHYELASDYYYSLWYKKSPHPPGGEHD
jgi:hypothetical protein